MNTATLSLPSKAFPSKFPGKCANTACSFGGSIQRGQMIRWSRGQKPAKVWHDGPCYDTRYENSARLDTDVAPDTSMRDNGPLFDAPKPVAKPIAAKPVADSSQSGDFLAGLATALAPYLDSKLQGLVDQDMVMQLITQALDGAMLKTVTTVEVMDYSQDSIKDLGLQHKLFPMLLGCCNARTSDGHRLNIWLTGPAGSGKTTAAKNVALALGLEYRFTGSIDTEYKLMGFIDAQGRIVNTQFRQAYEFGGVFLFDEVDSSLPGALLAFNAALANGEAAFPDGIVKRHNDFCCIAAANTWGLGANSDYVGRLKLDAAFLDRFVQLAWNIDAELELATAGNAAWVKRVQALRAAALSKGVKSIISPRASYFGAALLTSGMPQDQVETLAVRKAMSDDQWGAICGVAK